MAQEHNALKYNTALIRGVKRLFGVDDHEQGTTRISETLYPVVDLFQRAEHRYARSEFQWQAALTQGAVVGDLSSCGISNPQGSGKIVVIEGAIPSLGASLAVEARIGINLAFTGTGTPTQTDLRVPNFPNPSLATVSFTHHQVAALGSLLRSQLIAANTAVDFLGGGRQVILTPGFFFALSLTVANTAFGPVNLYGYERQAMPGELLSFAS